jgi:hypothetical protein
MSEDVVFLTHGGGVRIAPVPAGAMTLSGPGGRDSLVVTTRLRNAQGEVIGVATQQEHFPNGKGPQATWSSWWSIMVPGRGTLYAATTETVPPAHLAAFRQAASGQTWSGSAPGQVTNGPRGDRLGEILAGTGVWTGARGTLAEHVTLQRLTADGRFTGAMEVQLRLEP